MIVTSFIICTRNYNYFTKYDKCTFVFLFKNQSQCKGLTEQGKLILFNNYNTIIQLNITHLKCEKKSEMYLY